MINLEEIRKKFKEQEEEKRRIFEEKKRKDILCMIHAKNKKIKILNNTYYYLGTGKRGAKIYICFKKNDKEYEKNRIVVCYYDEKTKKMKANYITFNDKFKTRKDFYEYFNGCEVAFGNTYYTLNGEKVTDIQRQMAIFWYFVNLYNTKLKNVWGKDNFNYIRLRDKIYRELKKLIKN